MVAGTKVESVGEWVFRYADADGLVGHVDDRMLGVESDDALNR
ncbi:MAG: hypothetical protein OEY23_17405 [Acidimicrobiia bacterium]|nr:hypothetical protein [Acidimicrobiia bacterium]